MNEDLRHELLRMTDESHGPRPIEEPEQLDARRTSMGLEPFAEYEARMRELERSDG